MRPKTLDHVALWVADRDSIADFATEHLGMHVIERTERFTLVGSDARRGKLTLFAIGDLWTYSTLNGVQDRTGPGLRLGRSRAARVGARMLKPFQSREAVAF